MGRRSIIIIENFYSDPKAVREWALKQKVYYPYEPIKTWATNWYRQYEDCPFKTSTALVECLEDAVGEQIDMDNWKAPFPFNAVIGAASQVNHTTIAASRSCLWNCAIHVKLDAGQREGDGVHNHVTDYWNSVGPHGWAGIIYLSDNAPVDGGLNLWRNVDPSRNYKWMPDRKEWVHLDKLANIPNRLLLVRGNIPHSGANGWGKKIEEGRMYQTFFFRTTGNQEDFSVDVGNDVKL